MNRTHLAVLGLLAIEPASGYDLKLLADTSLSHFWKLSYGSVYPALHELERAGLVEGHREARRAAPDARIYALTPRGREELTRWLERAPAEDQIRSELVLKVFLGVHADRGALVRHLEGEAERVGARLGALRTMQARLAADGAGNPSLPFWQLAIRRGILGAEARLTWTREALQEIRGC